MPLYEYECARCGRFEIIRKFSDAPLMTCPTCGGEIQKLASAPAIQFKGTGWYITDYARKSGTGKDTSGKAGEGSSTSSASKDGGSGSKDAGKDAGSEAKDSGTKAAASGDSAPSKGSSGGGGGGSSTK